MTIWALTECLLPGQRPDRLRGLVGSSDSAVATKPTCRTGCAGVNGVFGDPAIMRLGV